jgi:hypothetical protein
LFGGTTVTITGTHLANVTAISFGTTAATSFISDSDTQIVLASPAASLAGPVNVTVTTPSGTSATSPADLFFYSNPGAVVPTVSSISPKFGPPRGGTLVTITGTGFDPTATNAVYFGLTAATSVHVVSFTKLTAVSPAGTGTVHVTVITLGGASHALEADLFTYTVDGPRVTSVRRYGVHAEPTYLVINFNGPLDPSPAENTSNYRIVGPGGQRIGVISAIYDSETDSVTLTPAVRLNLGTSYRLTVNGTAPSGLRSREGLLLDGAGTGQPGSDFVTLITSRNLAGSASQLPTLGLINAASLLMAPAQASPHPNPATLQKAAVDVLLATESLHVTRRRPRH